MPAAERKQACTEEYAADYAASRGKSQKGVLDMGLNQTPAAERVHIGFFGRRNAGKSSLMNAVTGQELACLLYTSDAADA